MNKKIWIGLVIVFLLANFVSSFDETVFQLILEYDQGSVTQENLLIVPGKSSDNPVTFGPYKLDVEDGNEEVLYEEYFDFFKRVPFDEYDDESFYLQQTVSKELIFPYFEEAISIKIYDVGEESVILEIPLKTTCNENGVCDPTETPGSCPNDCSDDLTQQAQQGIIPNEGGCNNLADGICRPTCSEDPDCKGINKIGVEKEDSKEGLGTYYIIGGIILFIILIIALLLIFRSKIAV
tara:strand:- start:553 stop:1263 length:711 start_codon:yes stop_codon:yes gene_type:complete